MKIGLCSSSGGHLDELMQLKCLYTMHEYFFVNPSDAATYKIVNLSRENIVTAIYNFIINFIQSLRIYTKERPDVIISTGALAAVPFCLIGKIAGTKLIFIESFARVETPSKTGLLMYKIADVFIVQWQDLKKYYPNAIYGGWIY